MKSIATSLVAFALANVFAHSAQSAELSRLRLDTHSTTTDNCKVLPVKMEPAGLLTYKFQGKALTSKIYSDLCVTTAQWYTDVYFNADEDIVGLTTGDPAANDGVLRISDKWTVLNLGVRQQPN